MRTSEPGITTRTATREDLPEIRSILSGLKLPVDGIPEHLSDFLVGELDQRMIGLIGLEVYHEAGLVRSAAVIQEFQDQGIGGQLLAMIEKHAIARGVRVLLLLTTTAEKFFSRKGFSRIERSEVSGDVLTSVEFRTACPGDAVCMRKLLNPADESAKRVLIVCTGNSCRSQMAEGLLREMSGGALHVESAGTHPSFVHPLAIKVMQEIGIDIAHHRSKSVDEFAVDHFDLVVTVCDQARKACPAFPNAKQTIHIPIEDPVMSRGDEDSRMEKFREARERMSREMVSIYQTLLKTQVN